MVLTLLAGGYGGAASRVGISEPDSFYLEIEILNVAGPWEPKEPGVYDWTLAMLRFLIGRFPERDPQKSPASRGAGRKSGGSATELLGGGAILN